MSFSNTDELISTKADELRVAREAELRDIELTVTTGYTLADAIREGATVTEHNGSGWANLDNGSVCALSAGVIAARSRGFI